MLTSLVVPFFPPERNHSYHEVPMKKTGILLLLALTGAMMPLCVSAQSLIVGTNSVPLIFEDTNLPQVNRVRLADDLCEAFEWAATLGDAFELVPNAPLGFGHVREPFDMTMPSDLWDGLCLTNQEGTVSGFVIRTLSDAHAARLSRFAGHFMDIVSLRDRVITANEAGFDSLTLQEKADFFWHGGTVPAYVTPEQQTAFETQIVPMLRSYIVYPPSLFRMDGPQTADGDIASLVGWCVFVPRTGTNGSITAIPIGLVNGQWKFFFGL